MSSAVFSSRGLSFEGVVPGGVVPVTEDGLIFAVELAMVVTGKNKNHAGYDLRRLPENVYPSLKFSERKFSGRGNYKVKLVTLKDAIELIMVLPGKMAKEYRAKFADIIQRYLAGDASLIVELHANAQSSHPIQQLARESVAQEQQALTGHKRDREEMDEMVKFGESFMHSVVVARDTLRETVALSRELSAIEVKREQDKLAIHDSDRLKTLEFERARMSLADEERRKLAAVEVKREQDKLAIQHSDRLKILEFERERMSLADEERRKAMEHKKAMKGLDEPAVPVAPVIPSATDPSCLTVLKVYNKNKPMFPLIKKPDLNSFLISAGRVAKNAYEKSTGDTPVMVSEDAQWNHVCGYPLSAESTLLHALRTEYRRRTLGGNQPAIEGYLVVPLMEQLASI